MPQDLRNRIVTKMEWFALQENPLSFAKCMSGKYTGAWRFRIGDYRVICDVIRDHVQVLQILSVKDRKDAYR